MSGRAVKVSSELLESARREAEVMSTVGGAPDRALGGTRCSIEKSGRFSQLRIAQFLQGDLDFDHLNALEGTVAADRLVEFLEKARPGPSFLDSLRRTGVPCSGIVEVSGEVVRVHPDGRVERVARDDSPPVP